MADINDVPFVNFSNEVAQAGLTSQETARTQQQTGLMGQQTQELAMKNQLMRATMPLIMNSLKEAYGDQTGANAGADNSGVTGMSHGFYDADNIEDTYRRANYVPPYTPQEMQQIRAGYAAKMATGNDSLLAQAQQARQMRIDSATAANQLNMGNIYDSMDKGVANAPPGRAFDALEQIAPDAAAKIRQHWAGQPDETRNEDQEARDFAAHVAGVSHLYAGRPTKMENGVLIDEREGRPVPGTQQIFTGLNPEQRQKEFNFWNDPIDVTFTDGTTQKMPRWKAPQDQGGTGGKYTPAQMVARADRIARNQPEAGAPSPADNSRVTSNQSGARPIATPAQAQQGAAAQQTRTAGAQSQAVRATAPGPLPGAITGAPPQAGTPEYGQRVRSALADPEYKDQYDPDNMPHQAGAPKPGVKEKIDQSLANRKDAAGEFNDHAKAASTALMNFGEAKRVLQGYYDGQPITNISGFPARILSELATKMGVDSVTANTRAEVAKYLTNAAVAGIKDTYGSRPGVYDVKINVEKAFPSIDMPGKATTDLIDSQMRQAQYMLDSANRGQAYLRQHNDPLAYNNWNEHYFPREKYVEGGPTATGNQAYSTKEDVRQAVRAGKLKRADAVKMLQERFGMAP